MNPRTLESSLAVAALYDSLHTLKGCERLLEHPIADWSEVFRPIVQEQIKNRTREREIAMQLASITGIDDAISLAVRAQYEENPYPRWMHAASASASITLDEHLRAQFPTAAFQPLGSSSGGAPTAGISGVPKAGRIIASGNRSTVAAAAKRA